MKLSDEIINSLSINLRKKINNIKNQSINIDLSVFIDSVV